jgi:hypothetical protein
VALDDYVRPSRGLPGAQTAAVVWTGRAWKLVASRNPLVDVSCLPGVALSGCTYLSYLEASPGVVSLATLSERGGGWVAIGDTHGSTPIKANPNLFAYTCSSASSCMTVGYTVHPAQTQSAYIETFATRWDGRRWSTTSTPSPPPPSVEGGDDTLNGVSCPAPDDCLAVGIATFTPLVESWNGSRWTEQPLG